MIFNLLVKITRFEAKMLNRKNLSNIKDPFGCQTSVLLKKLRNSQFSEYGKKHGFSSIKNTDDYRAAVPINTYSDLKPYIQKTLNGDVSALFNPGEKILMFAMTSGTTDACKYIPVTQSFLDEYKRGSLMWGMQAVDDHLDILRTKILAIVSHFDEQRSPGNIPCGSISGLAVATQKRIARLIYALPYWVYAIADQDAKYYTILRLALAESDIGLVTTANPSTLIKLAKCADKHKESLIRDIHDGTFATAKHLSASQIKGLKNHIRKNPVRARLLSAIAEQNDSFYPRHFWDKMVLLATWKGGVLGHYIDMLPDFYGSLPVRDLGLIASEGRMSIPHHDQGADGVLDIASHFFEFIPEEEYETENPRTLLCHELEKGRKYYLILTNSAGYFRYDINDLIEVTDFFEQTPVIHFLNKGKHISSLTGEKVSEHQVASALRNTLQELGISLNLFTVCPRWDEVTAHYDILVENDAWLDQVDTSDFITIFDTSLQSLNLEYKAKRDSQRLGPPRLCVVSKGTFAKIREEKHTQSQGRTEQYKHVYLNPTVDYYQNFTILKEIKTSDERQTTSR
jgi:hypothetical protein